MNKSGLCSLYFCPKINQSILDFELNLYLGEKKNPRKKKSRQPNISPAFALLFFLHNAPKFWSGNARRSNFGHQGYLELKQNLKYITFWTALK